MDGAFAGDGIEVAVAALEPDELVIVTTEGLPPDARFESGSVTKTMTATLLAITLGQLATHTSGLPRDAPNDSFGGPDSYRDFTAERAEERLRMVIREPGNGRIYSNFGYRLLGLVLERAGGRPYQALLAERLLGPLGMTCSGVGAAGPDCPGMPWGGRPTTGSAHCPAPPAWRPARATWPATWRRCWPRRRGGSATPSPCVCSRACG